MFRRTVPFLALLFVVSACQEPDRVTTLRTGGYHIVDDRGWAVGSIVSFSADGSMVGNLDIVLEQDDAVIAQGDGAVDYWGGSSNWVSGEVVAEGAFDLIVTNSFGVEQERTSLQTKVIDGYRMGVLLDDCPEYPDLVLEGQPTLLQGATVNVAPAPVDADGNQLLGTFEFSASSTIDNSEWSDFEDGWWGGFATLNVGQTGDVTFTIDGEQHVFPVDTVSAADVIEIEIAAIPEKHGVADQSLLCALGRTADGRVVHGINADWSGGGVSQTIHAPNNSAVEACFDGKCTTWDGVR